VLPDDGNPFAPGAPSEATRHLVDEAVKRLVDGAHDRVFALLSANRDRLDSLAHALLDSETLDQDAVYAAAGIDLPRSPLDVSPAPA
jgi:cell division protease FtsH